MKIEQQIPGMNRAREAQHYLSNFLKELGYE